MEAATVVASLAALAQESRLRIYRLLVEAGPAGLSVGEIGATVRIAPATLSFHLKELSHAGLVRSRQEGRFIFYSAHYQRMNRLVEFLTEKCCSRDACCAPGCGPRKRASAGRGNGGDTRRTRGDIPKSSTQE